MFRSFLCLSLLFVVSCSTHKSGTAATTAATTGSTTAASTAATTAASTAASTAATAPQGRRPMSERFNGGPIKQGPNGQWPDSMEKYSASNGNRQSAYFTQTSNIAKPYKTGDYAKTAWAGKINEVAKTAYAGKTDGSRFHTPSRVAQGDARETNAAAVVHDPYKTGDYKTSAARESNAKRLDKPSDAQTDVRRRVFPDPEITSWKEQRALDMKATKSILGRE